VYACCLSKNTGISFAWMKLAWFDDKIYYEADAMEVYKCVMQSFRKVSRRVQIAINKTLKKPRI